MWRRAPELQPNQQEAPEEDAHSFTKNSRVHPYKLNFIHSGLEYRRGERGIISHSSTVGYLAA